MSEFTAWGLTYDDICKLKREREKYRFALSTIAHGSFGKEPPRDIRGAKSIAIRSLVKP